MNSTSLSPVILCGGTGSRLWPLSRSSFPKQYLSLFDESTGTKIIAFPSNNFEINVDIDYNSKVLGKQNATLNNISEFQNKISSSRTFCFLHELETLIDNNLIKGGNINNAIVIVEEEINDDLLVEPDEVEESDHEEEVKEFSAVGAVAGVSTPVGTGPKHPGYDKLRKKQKKKKRK